MDAKIPLHFVIILLLVISIASTNIPRGARWQPAPSVSWHMALDEESGNYQFSLKQDSTSRKVYCVGIESEGAPMTVDQTAFDADLYFDLYQDFWVFSENTWGVTVFHLWREGDLIKITVNGVTQRDFDPDEQNAKPAQGVDLLMATL